MDNGSASSLLAASMAVIGSSNIGHNGIWHTPIPRGNRVLRVVDMPFTIHWLPEGILSVNIKGERVDIPERVYQYIDYGSKARIAASVRDYLELEFKDSAPGCALRIYWDGE